MAHQRLTSLKESYQALLKAMIWLFEHNLPDTGANNRSTALVLSSLCVGGMILSRTIPNEELAEELRQAAQDHSMNTISGKYP